MIVPDEADGDRTGTRPSRPVLGMAALIVLFTVVAIGWLMGPSGETPREDTTTATEARAKEDFDVSQIARGHPLGPPATAVFDTGLPIALLEHGGSIYAFAADVPAERPEPAGMLGWVSDDGVAWRNLGQVISSDFTVDAVASTSTGLVAAGRRAGSVSITTWRSDHGRSWEGTESPPLTDTSYLVPHASLVAAIDDAVVVAGDVSLDRELLLEDRLGDNGIDVDLATVSWDTRETGEGAIVLRVYGPLGTPVVDTTLEALGLSEMEQTWIDSGYRGGPGTDVWVSRPGPGSRTGTIPASDVSSMVDLPGGGLLALFPEGSFTTNDGVTWREATSAPGPALAERWGNALVGVTDRSPVEIVMSGDGQTWEDAGVAADFPASLRWRETALGAGAEGVAMAVESRTGALVRPVEPVTLSSDGGAALTLDFARGTIRLEAGGATSTWVWSGGDTIGDPTGIVPVLDTERVAFTDRCGDPLAEFSFAELSRARNAYNIARFEPISHQALVFSRDGGDWAIQDVGGEIGHDVRMELLEVSRGRVVAAVRHGREPFSPYPVPGFTIWSAALP